MTNGSVRPGTSGAWCTTKLNTVPLPLATLIFDGRLFVLPQRGHRRMLQAAVGPLLDAQLVRVAPSQKNFVSRDDAGRIVASASRSSGTCEHRHQRSAGLNFIMRHIISATSSSPTCQVIFCVMK